jgi:hypothetical protein
MIEIWVGSNYKESTRKTLVLGESWYGTECSLNEYIPQWAARKIRDNTFSRIFNAGSGLHTSTATEHEILEFWKKIVFYNYVVGTVGDTRSHRPTKNQYESSKPQLASVLQEYKPQGIWVLGKEQAQYSVPIIQESGFAYEVVAHPTSLGLKASVLQESWQALQAKIA